MTGARQMRACAAAAAVAAVFLLPTDTDAQTACTVTFRLQSHVDLASLQYEVAYPRPDIELVGSGTSVSCVNLAPALPTFTDDDTGPLGLLQAAYIAPGGFSGPANLVVCDFTTIDEPLLSDFLVTVVDATDSSFQTVSPLPVVVPSQVDCGGVFDTTTTTSTSTSTTTSTLPYSPMVCTVDFSLTDAITLGSLQWEVDYTNAPGEVAGSGTSVQCQNKVTTAFSSMTDNETRHVVTTALISLSGFSGPRLLTSCTFLADDFPSIGDFQVTVTDAADTSITPVSPFPGVAVSGLSCAADTTSTTSTSSTTTTTLPDCGNGLPDPGEECDDGPSNSNAVPGGCRLDCSYDRVCGDGDGNGTVNVVDAQWVLKAAINLVAPCPLTACDASSDASVTVSDAQRILFHVVGLVPDLVCALPITLRIEDPVTLGSVMLEVAYGATNESFLGEGGGVVCDPLLGGVTATFDNDAVAESLTVSLSRPGGFTGPVDLAECMFRAVDEKPDPDDFQIAIDGATAPGGAPVPPPALTLDY